MRGQGERTEDTKGSGMAERIEVEVSEDVDSLRTFCHLYFTLIRKIFKNRPESL